MTKPVWVSRDGSRRGNPMNIDVWQGSQPDVTRGLPGNVAFGATEEHSYLGAMDIEVAHAIGAGLAPGECRHVVFTCHPADEPSREELAAALNKATYELNLIRARDGAPQHLHWDQGRVMQTNGCDPEYFDSLVNECLAILARVKGGA